MRLLFTNLAILLIQLDIIFARYLDTKQQVPNGYDTARVSKNPEQLKVICDACELVVPTLQKLIAENKTEHIKPYVTFICNEFKIESPTVCDLVIKEYGVSSIKKHLSFFLIFNFNN